MENDLPEDHIDDELERSAIMANDEDPLEALSRIRLEEEKAAASEEDPKDTDEEDENKEPPVGEDLDDDDDENKDNDENEGEGEGEESLEDEPDEPKVRKFRANGQDFEFTQEEINQQFGTVFGKAMDYTHKMQKISPYRKMISALEEENISQDQLNLAIDALKGDKGAIQKIVAENSIDIYDLDNEDEDNTYTGNDYGKSPSEIALDEVQSQIMQDPEYPQTVSVIKDQWDDSSREALADNPEWIAGLHSDIKSGIFAKVSPEATKLKMLDGGSKPDIEYYLLAGQQILEKDQQVEDPVKKSDKQFKNDSAVATKKRSASSTRSRAGSKGVINYLDDNDEEFDKWYDNIIKNN